MKRIVFASFIVAILFSCKTNIPDTDAQISIIPKPLKIEQINSSFTINEQTNIIFQNDIEGFEKVAKYLHDEIKKNLNLDLELIASSNNTKKNSILLLQDLNSDLGDEAYIFESSKKSIKILSQTANGAFYGVQTLLQLIDIN